MTVDKITTQQVKIEINDVTLLSEEEYLACKDNISIINNCWWLRSPDYLQCYATYVNNDGSPCFNTVDYDSACIRPALRISNLESSNLKIGDKVFIADYVWTVIANDLILCDNIVMYSCFREDWHAEDANNYEASDVKKKLEKWAMEHSIITQRKMKSTYQVMSELSNVWQNMSDTQKSIVTNFLAETSSNKALKILNEAIEQIRLMEEILSKAKLDTTN